MDNNIILEVKELKKHFQVGRGRVLKAVDGVSFKLEKGKTLGIVGESGCGKSTLGKLLVHLHESTDGKILFEGKDITKLSNRQLRDISNSIQMIFQDPYSSLNPRMTIGDIVSEGYDIRKLYKGNERKEKIIEVLEKVGLNEEHINRFAHEFSGGQRQRIGISRALSLNPKLIICDEPISALDVSIQAQVMNLLIDLQKELGLTYVFIAHDLSMVKHISDDIAVMYLGNIVEYANSDKLYDNPLHPYTKALFSANPVPNPDLEKIRNEETLEGDVPSPINPKPGCEFHTRCSKVMDICKCETPTYFEVEKDHYIACHIYNK